MDSEKYNEVQELIKKGRSPNDEGPFYHHTFWESYKGSIKGKLGGVVIGGLIGALVGTAVFLLLPELGLAASALSATGIIGGMAAAGVMYAAHEFGEIGRITGAISASEKDAEKRMQEFEKSKFEEIKQDINELKSIVKGEAPAEAVKTSSTPSPQIDDDDDIEEKLSNYRVAHHDPSIKKPAGNSLVFWNVALVGLAVGAGIGLLMHAVAGAGIASGIGLGSLLGTAESAAVTMGLVGASFGINRDIFRKIFDKTDLLFKGMVAMKTPRQPKQEQNLMISASAERPLEKMPVKTLVYTDSNIEYPISETHHRDKVLANARQALAAMDHTTASRH